MTNIHSDTTHQVDPSKTKNIQNHAASSGTDINSQERANTQLKDYPSVKAGDKNDRSAGEELPDEWAAQARIWDSQNRLNEAQDTAHPFAPRDMQESKLP